MIKAICLTIVVHILLSSAWAQKAGEVVGPEKVSFQFLTLFQRGDTSVRHVALTSIPKAPPIPTGYQQVGSYVIRSGMIGSDGVLTVTSSAKDESEFKSVRILELEPNELYPSGYEWSDCTMLPRTLDDVDEATTFAYKKSVERYNLENAKYFPNFGAKKLSCSPQMYRGDGTDLFVSVVRMVSPPPKTPFTTIKLKLDNIPVENSEDLRYVLTITNTGMKDAVEINLDSEFSADVDMVAVKSSQGSCKRSTMQTPGGAICHLGSVRAGQSATIELFGLPNHLSSNDPLHQVIPNQYWHVLVYTKERAADPHWFANRFQFEPLKPLD
jgi:hypothetical protein